MKWLLFISLSLFMILSSYFKGLYYSKDLYLPVLLIHTIFLPFLVLGRKNKSWGKVNQVSAIFLIPLIYLVSAFGAENPQGAWDSYIRWTFYSAFFWLLYDTSSHRKIHSILPFTIQVTGFVIALTPILHYFEIREFRSSIVADRFAGVFQYPNTFGMVIGAFALFSLIMLSKDNSLTEKAFYSIPVVFLFLGLLQSQSRAMFLIFPILWFMGLLLLRVTFQVRYIFFTLVGAALALLVFQNMLLSFLIAAAAIFVLSAVSFDWALNKLRWKMNLKRWMLPMLVAILWTLALLDLVNEGLLFRQMPLKLQERITSIQLSTPTAQERFTFLADGLKMSKDYLLFGAGGEGWASIYKKYQSLPYLSNKAHNGFLEVLIDTGIFGLTVFIGVFVWLIIKIMKAYKQTHENTVQAAVLISISAIFTHSFIDFNFSYGTVWLIVLWLIITGLNPPNTERIETWENNIVKWGMVVSIVGIILFASVLSYRFIQAERMYKLSNQSNSKEMKELLIEKALSFNPNNKKYLLKSSEFAQVEKLEEAASTLTEAEPNNSTMYLKAGDMLVKAGDIPIAIEKYREGLKRDQYNKELYEASIKTSVTYATGLLKNKQTEDAKTHLIDAITDFKTYQTKLTDFNEKVPTNRDRYNSREFDMTSQTAYNATLSYFLLGMYDEAAAMYKPGQHRTTEDENIAALAVLSYEKMGKSQEAKKIIKEQEENNPGFNKNVEYFRTLFYKLFNKIM